LKRHWQFIMFVAVFKCGLSTAHLTDQQAATAVVSDQGSVIRPTTARHLQAADRLIGADYPGIRLLCNSAIPSGLRAPITSTGELQAREKALNRSGKAARVFDNFYYFGVDNVNSWALITDDGIVVFDALNSEKDWVEKIEPSMLSVGLDPSLIRFVIVTHGHGDHFGGSAYLARRYHARVLMSDADWELAPTMLDKPEFDPPPPKDLVIHDGQVLRVGNASITLYATPGHTMGTVSALIPVVESGHQHLVALWGGTGFNFPHTRARFSVYLNSVNRFRVAAARAGADVPLANHPEIDMSLFKLDQLAGRKSNEANPFVQGTAGVVRFLDAISECAHAYSDQL
jgi:metallo-beta-lactamase class B